jgi:hypothetical protein
VLFGSTSGSWTGSFGVVVIPDPVPRERLAMRWPIRAQDSLLWRETALIPTEAARTGLMRTDGPGSLHRCVRTAPSRRDPGTLPVS